MTGPVVPEEVSGTLPQEFAHHLDSLLTNGRHSPLLVAVSGGADSMALLHLLRFGPGSASRDVCAVHVDHAVRTESARDAEWLAGVCRVWDVPLRSVRLDPPPRNETEARDARYRVLEDLRDEVGAGAILTAHHREDRAETVLFRALRGTGLSGLAGILPVQNGRVRPLLNVSKARLRAYAEAVGLRWREDATNHDGSNVRSRLRRDLLPRLEDTVAPGAVDALVRLADHAARHRVEVEALTDALLERMIETPPSARGELRLNRSAVVGAPEAARPLLLRRAAERLGVRLDAASTARVLTAAETLGPGARVDLRSGGVLHVAHDHWILVAPESPHPQRPEAFPGGSPRPGAAPPALQIPEPSCGSGSVDLAGRRLQVQWGRGTPRATDDEAAASAHLDPESITFPLTLRGWRDGDRVRLSVGSTPVVRLLSEARIPVLDRPRSPLVCDADGRVLWVPDLDRRAAPRPTTPSFWMRITDAEG